MRSAWNRPLMVYRGTAEGVEVWVVTPYGDRQVAFISAEDSRRPAHRRSKRARVPLPAELRRLHPELWQA